MTSISYRPSRRLGGVPDWRGCLVLGLVSSWLGCVAPASKDRDAARSPAPALPTAATPMESSMGLEDSVALGLALGAEESDAWTRLHGAVRGREYAFFAEVMAAAAREKWDQPAMHRLLRVSAEWVGAGRKPAELLAFARELSHRECCTRASYVGAAIEGWVSGLQQGGPVFATTEVETRQRLLELADHADPRIAQPARAALPYLGEKAPTVTPDR
ncbi:MAG: hypothetical protein JNK85_02270 [Verrucomicrobiales bacterium]|nr:hypothetical protein [Verrucomicrobiales bacterium]